MAEDESDYPEKQQGKTQSSGNEPQVGPGIQEVIGQGLRAMYDSLKAEPIPDHLLELLKKLDQPQRDDGQ
ncbi:MULTISPECIES: NepR family anti-sigma factor [Microvirga]|uniref:NepR family anti-sigma factor n=1 Tax=Microvirga TaxID=186650 RepID=UPI001CFF63EC|nr:NepR family anti-sigma factor [Microvirga lenta]MCB5175795.1 hypothetical protein [Microvirga lenta]